MIRNQIYILYAAAYEFWKYCLYSGHPISFNLIKEIIKNNDWNKILESTYLQDVKSMKTYSDAFSYRMTSYNYYTQSIESKSGLISSKIDRSSKESLSNKKIQVKELNDIMVNEFEIHLMRMYYWVADWDVVNIKPRLKPFSDKFIFIEKYLLTGFDVNYDKFVTQEMADFKVTLKKVDLDFVEIKNQLQKDIFGKIQDQNISLTDVQLICSVDYEVEHLNNESEFADFISTFFDTLSNVENKTINKLIQISIREGLRSRIEDILMTRGAPSIEWFEKKWNGKDNPVKPNTPYENINVPKNIILEEHQELIFNTIKVYFLQEDLADLKNVISGVAIARKLEFRTDKTKILTFFAECYKKNYLVKSTMQELAVWIEDRFLPRKKKMEVKFDIKHIKDFLEDGTRHSSKNIVIN